jgi:hypothetical protein
MGLKIPSCTSVNAGIKPWGLRPLELLFLMAIFSQTLFAFVGGHFVTFSFFTARHKGLV